MNFTSHICPLLFDNILPIKKRLLSIAGDALGLNQGL
jgi:hypothetical protein